MADPFDDLKRLIEEQRSMLGDHFDSDEKSFAQMNALLVGLGRAIASGHAVKASSSATVALLVAIASAALSFWGSYQVYGARVTNLESLELGKRLPKIEYSLDEHGRVLAELRVALAKNTDATTQLREAVIRIRPLP